MTDAGKRAAVARLIVVSGLIIALCMGLRQSLGLFLGPMTGTLGISAATFAFSIALQNIVWGVSQPVVGALADRHGARPVLVATALVYAAGLAVMALGTSVPGGLLLSGVLIGLGTAGTGFGVLMGVVSRAVPEERRTRTMGVVAAAGSLGTLFIAPAGQAIIGAAGWKSALGAFALVAAAMALLAFGVREPGRPARGSAAAPPPVALGTAVREALAHRGYLFMTLAFFACGFQLIFISTHLPKYLQICGVAPAVGATALALIGLFNTVGTYVFGVLGSRYSAKRLVALIYLARTAAIVAFLLLPVAPATALVFAAAMGFLWLGTVPLVGGILGRVFGLAHFNTLYGIVFLSHQLGSFFGAWMGGMILDRTGSYDDAWGALIAIGVIAFLLQWNMDERPPSRTPGVAAPAVA